MERVPTDVVADDVVRRYRAAIRRLELLVSAGLRRGLDADRIATGDAVVGDATQAYRERQLAAARTILDELERSARTVSPIVTRRAYASAAVAVDRVTIGSSRGVTSALEGRFGGIHQRTVNVLSANLSASLEQAARTARTNVETVFARANELEGALPARGVAGVGFVGRRADDAWRRVALETLAEGQVTLETRWQISRRLVDRLLEDGVTDALTGFVDSAGRRWSLDRYAEMVTRTTTREATSRATVNRMTEHGLALVTISSHPHIEDICTPYDGRTFALPGTPEEDRQGYGVIDNLPPFHPYCVHVTTPAGANLEAFERELGIAARESTVAPEPITPAAPPSPDLEGAASLRDGVRVSPAAKRAGADDVLGAVDDVHRMPADISGLDLPVGARKLSRGHAGGYRYYPRSGEGKDIIVDPAQAPGGNTKAVFAHELGHFVDHRLGPGARFASDVDDDLAGWREALEASGPIREIRRVLADGRAPVMLVDGSIEDRPLSSRHRHLLEYLVDPNEMWARSYTQWIASRAGRPDLVQKDETLAAMRLQWDDDEFEAIAAELDLYFRRRGLA